MQSSEKKAVIFDLDGVLLSTDHYHYLAWKSIADEEGIPFDETVNNRLRGISRMESLEIILSYSSRQYSEEEKEEMAEKKNRVYRSLLSKMTPKEVSEDVLFTLDELKRKSVLMAIGSASKNTKFILERTNLTSYFDAIVDGTMITKGKPDPEVFLLASKLLSYPPSSSYVIEDSYAGIEAGHRGGFMTIGIQDAKHSPYAEYQIEKLSDILDIVK